MIKFTKMHGAGNDYVYVNCFDEPMPNDPAVLAQREHVIGQVIALGYGIKHRLYFRGILVEVSAGHGRHSTKGVGPGGTWP